MLTEPRRVAYAVTVLLIGAPEVKAVTGKAEKMCQLKIALYLHMRN